MKCLKPSGKKIYENKNLIKNTFDTILDKI